MARAYMNLRIRIPPPSVVGSARPYAGYSGTDRERGAHTIAYRDGSLTDLHAGGRETGSSAAPGPSRRRRPAASVA